MPIIIKELYDKGYSINIISNKRKNTITKIKEINNALSSLNIPIIYVIGSDNIIAKPNKSIFDLLLNNKKWDKINHFTLATHWVEKGIGLMLIKSLLRILV